MGLFLIMVSYNSHLAPTISWFHGKTPRQEIQWIFQLVLSSTLKRKHQVLYLTLSVMEPMCIHLFQMRDHRYLLILLQLVSL